jgi:CBS domain containing-hemolysin-like protein
VLAELLLIVVLLLVNACFVAAEFALVRSRRTRLEALVRAGDRLARQALRASGDLPRLVAACQLGITLASLGLGWTARGLTRELVARLAPGLPSWMELSLAFGVGATVVVAALACVHVAVAELLPRAAAVAAPERMIRWTALPTRAFAALATPLLAIVAAIARPLSSTMGLRGALEEDVVRSPEELRLLVEQSEEKGTLDTQDADLIEGVFDFSEKTAREVMTPRTDIVAIPHDATLDETLVVVEEGGFSRYPVYRDTIDDIVGIVLAKDLLRLLRTPDTAFRLPAIVRPVHVVPGSREVEEVLADFKRLKEHMAVVLDEYGGTAGVVTMEDLLEEIVGDILDEYDEAEDAEPQPVRGATRGQILVPGGTNIGELNEHYGLGVPEGDQTTIGGFVFAQLGRLPRVGDRVTAGGAIFVVHAMEGRRIETLAVDLAAADRRQAPREEDEPAR